MEQKEGPDVLVKVKASGLMAVHSSDGGQMFAGLSTPYGRHSSTGLFTAQLL